MPPPVAMANGGAPVVTCDGLFVAPLGHNDESDARGGTTTCAMMLMRGSLDCWKIHFLEGVQGTYLGRQGKPKRFYGKF